MGCSTITFRLSNFEHGERSHQSVHNIRDLNGLLLYILRLGYWFFFLFYIIASRVGWWVGSEFILFLFIGKSYSGVFASLFLYFSLSWHAGVCGQGRIAFFSHLSKGAVLQILQGGLILLFHGARCDEVIFSFLSFLYWAGWTQMVQDIFGEHAFEFLYLI